MHNYTFRCVNLFRQINSTNRQADGVGRKKWTQNVRITQQPAPDQRQPRTAWVLIGSLDRASSTGTYSTAQQPTVRTAVSSDRSCAAVTRTSGYIYGPMQKYQVCYGIRRRNRTFFIKIQSRWNCTFVIEIQSCWNCTFVIEIQSCWNCTFVIEIQSCWNCTFVIEIQSCWNCTFVIKIQSRWNCTYYYRNGQISRF